MHKKICIRKRTFDRRGGTTALLAFVLPVLLILVAFVINFSYIELTRTQTFIAADAATRAGGRTYALTGDLALAKVKAREAASKNPVGGKAVTLSDSAFTLGTSTRASMANRYAFTAGGAKPNALEVRVDRTTASTDGAIPLLLPSVLGLSSFDVSKSSISTRVEVDIAFVVDRSGSMAYAADEKAVYPPLPINAPAGWFFGQPAPPKSRWLDLVAASNSFLTELTATPVDEQVALVTYGNTATINRAMTPNYSLIQSSIGVFTNAFPSGNTNIGDGIIKGVTAVGGGRAFASKVIVLMTDGIKNAGPDPVSQATKAAAKGVIIFTITFSNEADQTTMKKVAAAGMGQHFHAVNQAALADVLNTIARSLPSVLTR